MKALRLAVGLAALVCLTVALNIVLLAQAPSSGFTMWLFLGGGGLGLVWLVWTLVAFVKSQRESRTLYGVNAIVSSVVFLGICMTLYAFASHGDWSWDLTREGRQDLSEQTRNLLLGLDTDVNVYCFFLATSERVVDRARDKTARFLKRCGQYTEHLKIEWLDTEADFDRLRDLGVVGRPEQQGTIVIKAGASKPVVISLRGTDPRLEESEFANALINVAKGASPKLYFLTGHKERDVLDADERDGASLLKTLVETESYTIDRTAIPITRPELPADCDVLVINRPQTDLHPREIEAIQEYLDRGGSLLLLLDFGIRQAGGPEYMRPWLEQSYGILVGSDIVVSKNTQNSWEIPLLADISALAMEEFDDPNLEFTGCFSQAHPITRGFDLQMTLPYVRTVRLAEKLPAGVAGQEILRTLPDTWAETNMRQLLDTKKAGHDEGELQGSLSVAVAVTKKTDTPVGDDASQTRSARIVVVGDSDFASNNLIRVPGHFNFMMNALAWLTESEEIIGIRPRLKEDPPILLSDAQKQFISWVSTLGILQTVALAGVVTYLTRRKYQ